MKHSVVDYAIVPSTFRSILWCMNNTKKTPVAPMRIGYSLPALLMLRISRGCFTATDNEELSGSYLDRVMDIRSKLLGRLWTGDSNEKRCSMQWLHKHTNKENEK